MNIAQEMVCPGETRPKKAHQVQSNGKVFFTDFFDCNGTVYHEFLPQGRTVNKKCYFEATHGLRETIRQKCTELWKNQSWILHHDKASVHTSMLVREFFVKNKTVFTRLDRR